jgi:hypothetical protein
MESAAARPGRERLSGQRDLDAISPSPPTPRVEKPDPDPSRASWQADEGVALEAPNESVVEVPDDHEVAVGVHRHLRPLLVAGLVGVRRELAGDVRVDLELDASAPPDE